MSTESKCLKVSQRKYAYDSKKATEEGLIELGKQIAINYNKTEIYEQRYISLRCNQKEINDFSVIKFMADHERCHDNNVKTKMVYSMLKNIGIQNEIISCLEFLKKDIEKKHIGLQSEISDNNAMIDSYIVQLDESDIKYTSIKKELVKTQQQLETMNIKLKLSNEKCNKLSNENKYSINSKIIYLFVIVFVIIVMKLLKI